MPALSGIPTSCYVSPRGVDPLPCSPLENSSDASSLPWHFGEACKVWSGPGKAPCPAVLLEEAGGEGKAYNAHAEKGEERQIVACERKGRERESLRMMALVANFPMETGHGAERDWLPSLFCQITPGSDHTKKEREG